MVAEMTAVTKLIVAKLLLTLNVVYVDGLQKIRDL